MQALKMTIRLTTMKKVDYGAACVTDFHCLPQIQRLFIWEDEQNQFNGNAQLMRILFMGQLQYGR